MGNLKRILLPVWLLPVVVGALVGLPGLTTTASAAGGGGPASIGGPPVTSPAEAPWSVYIEGSRPGSLLGGLCTGSILDATHVLTAGHCTYDEESNPWTAFEVRAGITKAEPLGQPQEQRRTVVGVRRHPDFKSGTFPYDLAILTVSPAFTFTTANVQPIAVAPVNTPPPLGAPVAFYGWGQTAPNVQATEEHSLQQTTIAQWRCGPAIQGLPSFACRQGPTGAPCPGDSGSGVVSGAPPVLVGVVTLTDNCSVGALNSGPALTTPEVAAWLAGNESPPLAPRMESTPTLVSAGRAGEPAECQPGNWANSPTFETELVDPTDGAVFGRTNSTVIELPVSAVGIEVGCVILATNAGGTTEALSSDGIIVGSPRPVLHAASLVKVLGKTLRGGHWRVLLAVAPQEVGQHVHVVWSATGCKRCKAKRSVTLGKRTTVISPRLTRAANWSLRLNLPGVENGAAVWTAGPKKVRLPKLTRAHGRGRGHRRGHGHGERR